MTQRKECGWLTVCLLPGNAGGPVVPATVCSNADNDYRNSIS